MLDAALWDVFGEVFISIEGWDPYGGQSGDPNRPETESSGLGGDGWEYALVFNPLSHRKGNSAVTHGGVGLYDMDVQSLTLGTWDLNPAFLRIEIPYSGLPSVEPRGQPEGTMGEGDAPGFGGAAVVPEPATFVLVGLDSYHKFRIANEFKNGERV